jgi:hypothetical protein
MLLSSFDVAGLRDETRISRIVQLDPVLQTEDPARRLPTAAPALAIGRPTSAEPPGLFDTAKMSPFRAIWKAREYYWGESAGSSVPDITKAL